MILSELTGYLAQHRRVALTDMANRFGSSPEALRPMLDILARKGRVRRLDEGPSCASGCGGCSHASVEAYEWITPGAGASPQETSPKCHARP